MSTEPILARTRARRARPCRRVSSTDPVRQIHALDSVIVRDIDGNILSWNRGAERHYGWPRRAAVGRVSHHLLNTVFPCPLSKINEELLEKGFWEGELIHTMSAGVRVKVHSRWEVRQDGAESRVVEVNRVQEVVTPESAHLTGNEPLAIRVLRIFYQYRAWWLVSFAATLFVCWQLIEGTDHFQVIPMGE